MAEPDGPAPRRGKRNATEAKAKQPEAQTAGSSKAKAAAERKHLAKKHGTNNRADAQQAADAKKL